jgi:hypothetical protein
MARRRRTAPRNLIPEPITRALALHGPVQVSCGQGVGLVTAQPHVAPFDDMLVLFVLRSSPLLAGLDRDPRVVLLAQGGEDNYTIRIRGRGVDCGPASGHERRMEIIPWLPEGATLARFRAVELVPERIEYSYDGEEDREHFGGITAAADVPAPATRWFELCFGGNLPSAVIAFVALFAYVGWWGEWFTLRPVALLVALIVALGLQVSTRLAYRVLAHRRWQRGDAARHHGSYLSEGLLPVRGAVILALTAFGLVLPASLLCGVAWGGELLAVALGASMLWFLLPLWGIRFLGDMTTPAP